MRFTELKDNVAGTAESEFEDLDYNKVDKALKSVGVQLKDTTGQFRNLDDVFLELAKKWNTLDRNSQRYIATIAAGSRQQSRFIAMMEDYDRTMELVETAYNSTGRAAEQFAKYQDTVEYKMKKLANTWEQFRTSIANSGFFKGIITAVEKVLQYITNMNLGEVVINIISIVTAVKTLSALIDGLKNKSGSGLFKAIGEVKGLSGEIKEGFKKGSQTAEQKIENGMRAAADYHAKKITAALNGEYIEIPKKDPNEDDNPPSPKVPSKYDNFTKVASTVLKTVQIASMIISFGRMIGSAVDTYLEDIDNEAKEHYKTMSEMAEKSYTATNSKYVFKQGQELNNAIENIEKYKNRKFLDESEQTKLTEAINLLNSTYPQLIKTYDENTGKIELLTDKIEEQTELMEAQYEGSLKTELGAVGLSKTAAIRQQRDFWANQHAGTIENDDLIAQPATMATIIGGVLAVAGAIVGSIVAPGAGTIAGIEAGMAVGTAIGAGTGTVAGLGIGAQNQYLANQTLTASEAMGLFNQLPIETQRKVFTDLNKQIQTNINSSDELSRWMEDNTDNVQILCGITAKILDKISNKGIEKDAEKMAVQYLMSRTFTNAKGEEYTLSEEEALSYVRQKDLTPLVNLIDSISNNETKMLEDKTETIKEKLENYFDRINVVDKNGNTIINASEEFYNWYQKISQLFNDEGNAFKSWEEVSKNSSLLNIAAEAGYGTEDDYKKLSALTDLDLTKSFFFGDNLDWDKILEAFFDYYVGNAFNKTGIRTNLESEQEAIISDPRYEQWAEKANKIKMAVDITPEEAKEQLDNLKTEIEQNYNIEVAMQVVGAEDVEGTAANAMKTFDELKENLYNYFDSTFVDSMSGSMVSTMGNYITKTLAKLSDDSKFKQSAENFLKNQFSSSFANVLSYLTNGNDENIEEIQNYLTEILVPGEFDTSKLDEYVQHLTSLTHNGNLAYNAIHTLYRLLSDNNLTSTSNISIKDFDESIEKYNKDFQLVTKAVQNLSNGKLTSDDLNSILNSQFKGIVDTKTGELNFSTFVQSFVNHAKDEITAIENQVKDGLLTEAEANERFLKIQTQLQDNIKEFLELDDKLKESQDKAQRNLEKTERSLEKAKRSLEKAKKAYDEAQFGSENYIPSLDIFYNYDKSLENYNDDIERNNKLLEENGDLHEKIGLISEKNNKLHDKDVIIQAKLMSLNNAIADNETFLSQNSQFVKKVGDTWVMDKDVMGRDNINDELKNEILRRMDLENTWETQKKKLIQEKEDLDKEVIKEEKKYLQDYVKLIEAGAEKLKEVDQKEIDDLKDKYKSMEKADNDYLDALEDAINKQRKLREQENQYNDLATKEKKLSLMRRDTSGANQKEIQKLEQDIQKDREKMLDTEIDNVVDSMKELQESQKESRDVEIELKEAIVEATNYTQQFKDLMAGWTSEDDARAFVMENMDLEGKTTEEIEQMINDFIDVFNPGLNYIANLQKETVKKTNATTEEIKQKYAELGDFAAEVTNIQTKKVKENIEETINNAKDGVADAKDSIKDLEDSLKNLQKEYTNAEEAYNTWHNTIGTGTDSLMDSIKTSVRTTEEALIQTTAKSLLTLFSKKEIAKRFNMTSDELEEILNADLYKNITDKAKEKKEKESQNNFSKKKSIEKIREDFNSINGDKAVINNDYDLSFLREWDNNFKYQEGYKLDKNKMSSILRYIITDYEGNKVMTHSKKFAEDAANVGFEIESYDPVKGKTYLLNKLKAYANGGLVNYTGPAWVDGTPSKPEAFLNSLDTKRIGEAARILADIPILNSTSSSTNAVASTNIGDTQINIHLNIEEIASDYDVYNMIDLMKQEISSIAKPVGTPVILRK